MRLHPLPLIRFYLLLLLINLPARAVGQQTSREAYGENAKAGRYLNVGDARIYYEIYGQGKPVVLLHGGLFGYINEYEHLIPRLSEKFQVIAIATRGHGKSELGTKPLSYPLFAEDAYRVIRHLTKDSVTIIGFSDGADQGYYLATQHPEIVKRLVAIGGNLGTYDMSEETKKGVKELSAQLLNEQMPDFVTARKKLMPQPEQFDKFVTDLVRVWNQPHYMEEQTFQKITCPTLLVAVEKDGTPIERYVSIHRMLKNSQLAIVPGSDHIVLIRRPRLMNEIILPFLDEQYPLR
jgi:pimeloyl-ACP methyl ester carboxylesterase